ncbi:MAG TPA: serine hydrolase [Opitutaceae bacterium]|nr:serine hydrolase [Opitutaceae bacterium]
MFLSAVIGFAQDTTRMDEVAKAQAANDKFMGSVLVAKDDAVVFAQSYGWANLEWKIPNTHATKFRLGSVTKQFTAAAILLLEEKGKLKLDDPLAKFVPSAPETWKPVTVQQLLTHTSGIPSFTDFPDYRTLKLSPETPAQIMAHISDKPLDFLPGEKFKYSNMGYLLLGWIVEIASGQSYETFLREQIFRPLGMNDSGYDSNTAIIPQRAAGYVPGSHGLANAAYIDMHVPGGAGALYSTTADLLRWTQGLFGGKLLTPASLEKMTTPFKSYYAFGLMVTNAHGRKIISHNGGIDGFNSHLAYFPESKITVVVLSNVAGPAFAELGGQLEALAFGETVTLAAERKQVEVPAAVLQRYVGVYQLNPRITITVRLTDGQLTEQLFGQAALPIFPESEKKFFLKVVDAQVEFVADEQGHVTHLFLYQGGRTQKASRSSDTVVERTAIDLPQATLASCVGTYELRPGFDLTITWEDGHLMSRATGQGKAALFAEAETKFFLQVVDAQIEFFKDANGAVTHLVLHQGGQDHKGLRKP